MSDILKYTQNNNIEAILFSADFEKAFDSVDNMFLFANLKVSGFYIDFIQWVETFLKDCEGYEMNNGYLSRYFLFSRGTRPNDPLSVYQSVIQIREMMISKASM